MSNLKLTPWFPMATPPVRVGVYNVSCITKNQSGIWYSYWDGKSFNWYTYKPKDAFNEKNEGTGAGPSTKSWRGISK